MNIRPVIPDRQSTSGVCGVVISCNIGGCFQNRMVSCVCHWLVGEGALGWMLRLAAQDFAQRTVNKLLC